jgi:hypothetical protein
MTTLKARRGAKEHDSFRGLRTSMILDCEGGYLAGSRGGGTAFDWNGKPMRQFKGDSGVTHAANFIAAVRSRKPGDLRAEILEGHFSSALCHLANISYLVGAHRPPTQIAETLGGNGLLSESFERLAKHLQANEIDLAKMPLTAGPTLSFDPAREQFAGEGGERANRLLSRVYRQPFVLPENV